MSSKVSHDPEFKKDFVDALLECAVVRNNRDTLVSELRDDISRSYSKRDNDVADVMELVSRCLDFEEGVEELVENIRYFDGNSKPVKKVCELVPPFLKFSELVIAHAHMGVLLGILSEIKPRSLKQAYAESLPLEFVSRDVPKTVLSMVKRLCDFEASVSCHPILKFVDQVAAETPSLAHELEAWKSKVMQKFNVTDTRAAKLSCLHMVVVLDQAVNSKKKYSVQRFFWSRNFPGEWLPTPMWRPPEAFVEDNRVEINDTDLLFNTFEDFSEVLWCDIASLPVEQSKALKTIEFFLPKDIISFHADQQDHDIKIPPDQWEWNDQDIKVRMVLGKEYQVVARLLGRYKNRFTDKHRIFYGRWVSGWQCFHEMSVAPGGNHVHWECESCSYEANKLYDKLNNDKACLMMTFMPGENAKGASLTDALYTAGIPVALVCRKEPAPCNAEDEIRSLISENCLSDLQALVWNRRKQASHENGNDMGNHLTLIWDDPGRISPDFFYGKP